MGTKSAVRVAAIASKLGPEETSQKDRTLWRARLRVGTNKDEFLFRANDDFSGASEIAQELLESSPSCKMTGAEIIALERVARIWN